MSSGIFSNKRNFGESYRAPIKSNRIVLDTKPQNDTTPDISVLPDGEYEGRWYGYTFELTNGEKYKTKTGVRNSRRFSRLKPYKLINGELRAYSGLAEVGAGMQRMSYGHKPGDPTIYNPTRISIDTKGFRIPKKIEVENMVRNKPVKNKFFSKDGIFRGGSNNEQPSIKISNDNSIIRNKTNGGTESGILPLSKGTTVTYDSKKPFNLSIEPWVVTPLMTDTADGIYVGKLLGDKITSNTTTMMMGVKLSKATPEDVVVFVKDSKAYIFTIGQLAHHSVIRSSVFSDKCPADGCIQPDGDKWMIISNVTGQPWKPRYETEEKAANALKAYHANKGFSEITSDEEFRSYAHNLMQQAHKDSYSKEKTDKVVDDLLKNHEGKEYGELIGRLKSGMKTKSFADPVDPNSPQNPARPSTGVKPTRFTGPGGQVRDLGGQSNPISPTQPGTPKLAPTVNPNESEEGYSFEYTVNATAENTMEEVIGNLVYASAFVHLFHLCTSNYIFHKTLDGFYYRLPNLVDKLAEAYLSKVTTANFKLCVVPTSGCPIEYLTRLKEYLLGYIEEKGQEPEFKEFGTYFDQILELINATLYPMKRLKEGKKAFSVVEDEDREFSFKFSWPGKGSYKFTKGQVDDIREAITDAVLLIIKKTKKSPFKDMKRTDGRSVRQYVKDHTLDESDTTELISSLFKSLGDGIKQFIPKE